MDEQIKSRDHTTPLALIPLRTSFNSLIRLSFLFISIAWNLRLMCAIQALIGTRIKMAASPANMEGPIVRYRKTRAKTICSGPDHMMWRLFTRSINLWASTDISVTISPTVLVCLDLLLKRNAWGGTREGWREEGEGKEGENRDRERKREYCQVSMSTTNW